MKMLFRVCFAALTLLMAIPLAAEEDAAKKDPGESETPAPGIVINAVKETYPCILPVILTAVDGEALEESDAADRFELEPGAHDFSGYAGGDPSLCKTFADGAHAEAVQGGRIGEGTLKVNVESGKEYWLGVDARSSNPERWKIVVWKLKH